MSIIRLALIAILFLILAGIGVLIFANQEDDGGHEGHDGKHAQHEEVLKYRGSEAILPFDRILKMVRKRIKGEIIETEFEIEDEVPVYEIKYIRNDGRVMELYVDARSGRILKEEQD